jgi:hypothetical protein
MFDAAGTFGTYLHAYTADGLRGVDSVTITVNGPTIPPVPVASVIGRHVPVPLAVCFDGSSSDD